MTTATGWHVAGPAGSLFVDDGGPDGGRPPVVLVHSFGGSTAQWAPELMHLRRDRRAVALDLRGHGQSAAPGDGNFGVEALATDIGAVVDTLGLPSVVLVGHGLGAKAALEYAGAHPERVAGLVLAAAPARVPEARARQLIAGLEQDYDGMSNAITARLLDGASDQARSIVTRDAARIPRELAIRVIEASLLHDPVPALSRYPGPKLAIATPETDTPDDLHRLLADVPHETIHGTSHWMQLDRPEAFDRILDRFLERVEAG
jgi:pimeloyl-ACP methyl ester carboxylesterase